MNHLVWGLESAIKFALSTVDTAPFMQDFQQREGMMPKAIAQPMSPG